MVPYRLRLRLAAPTLTPWHADTMFGSLCWRLVQRAGEGALGDLLERCRSGDPPLVLSDGFSGDLLPAPVLPPRAVREGKVAGIRAQDSAKRERRLGYLTWEAFAARCRGELVETAAGGWERRLALRNTISRLTDTTGDVEGGLYPVAESVSKDGLLTVYLRVAPDFEQTARDLWQDLALTGYGRRASVGYGAFAIEGWDPWPALDELGEGSNAWCSLGAWVPAAEDPVDGWYRLRVKHGRVGEDLAARRNAGVFKRGLLMIEAGSTFRVQGRPREWYGRVVHDVYDAEPAVVQSGLALAVGVHLPDSEGA